MKLFTTLALLAGLALLVWILSQTDLVAAAAIVPRIGWLGAFAILALFAAAFGAEIVAWALILPKRAVTLSWVWAMWLVNMVGEAFNVLLPFGSLGGEPFKALLLKRHHSVPLAEATSSLVLMQTMLGIAEVPFVLIGVVLAIRLHILSDSLETSLIAAALVLAGLMALALVALHMRWLNHFSRRLERSRWRERFVRVIAAIDDVEHQMFTFVRRHPRHFAGSLVLFFANWVGGMIEVWLVLFLLGAQVSFAEAWVIESSVVLVRSATFFIPAHLGSLETVTVLVAAAFTGSSEIGLALALVRRARELIWSALGLAVGGWYNLKVPAGAPQDEA